MRGWIHGVNVDTSFFTGNYPSHCSIDALDASRPLTPAQYALPGPPWTPILGHSLLDGNAFNLFAISENRPWTHVRLNIFPDGGVARLRVHGEVDVDWAAIARTRRPVDLASIRMGGLVLAVNDMHYGAKDNLIMPGRARSMAGGWETRRRRGPGHDWAILKLGAPGRVTRIEIDTNHFKGNYPDSASVEACDAPEASLDALEAARWFDLLPRSPMKAHRRHFFPLARQAASVRVSHIRLNIFPDGGVSRLRIHGRVAMD
jgi:allantoicase